ncbi:hypothetical protein Hanom_Chr12g01122711 [Helianthus anomalus]
MIRIRIRIRRKSLDFSEAGSISESVLASLHPSTKPNQTKQTRSVLTTYINTFTTK